MRDRVAPKLAIKALSCCCVILQRLNLGMRLTSTSDMAGQTDGVPNLFSSDERATSLPAEMLRWLRQTAKGLSWQLDQGR